MSTSACPTDGPHSLYLTLSSPFFLSLSLSLFLCVFVYVSCCLPMAVLQSTRARTNVCYSLVERASATGRARVGERGNNIRNRLVRLLHKCQGPTHDIWNEFLFLISAACVAAAALQLLLLLCGASWRQLLHCISSRCLIFPLAHLLIYYVFRRHAAHNNNSNTTITRTEAQHRATNTLCPLWPSRCPAESDVCFGSSCSWRHYTAN